MTASRIVIGLPVALILLATLMTYALNRPRQDHVVAIVDGHQILASEYDAYSRVLSSEGRVKIRGSDVIDSLINQAIVMNEAERLGITINQDQVSIAMRQLEGSGIANAIIAQDGDLEAFSRRLRLKLTFDAVKTRVTRGVEVSDHDIAVFLARHEDLYRDRDGSAAEEVRPVVQRESVEAEWRRWLAARRACASIQVLRPGLPITTSTSEGCDALP